MLERYQEPVDLPAPQFAHIDQREFHRLERMAGAKLVYRVVTDDDMARRYVSPWIGPAQLRSTNEILNSDILSFLPQEDKIAVATLARDLRSGAIADATIVVGCQLGDGRLVPAAIHAMHVVSLEERLFDCTVVILDIERMQALSDNPLTPRQTEILRLLAEGISTDDLAKRLHLSNATVRNHIASIRNALGARSRIEAVAIARDRGILA